MSDFDEVKDMLLMIKEDGAAPKSLKEKINSMIGLIDSDKETQLKIESLQQTLQEISDDINLPSFVRTQIWSVSGVLETI